MGRKSPSTHKFAHPPPLGKIPHSRPPIPQTKFLPLFTRNFTILYYFGDFSGLHNQDFFQIWQGDTLTHKIDSLSQIYFIADIQWLFLNSYSMIGYVYHQNLLGFFSFFYRSSLKHIFEKFR